MGKNGQVLETRGDEARQGPPSTTEAGSPMDVSRRPKAFSRKRKGLPAQGNQGRAAETQAWTRQALERGEGQESSFGQKNERCNFRGEKGNRLAQDWRQERDR